MVPYIDYCHLFRNSIQKNLGAFNITRNTLIYPLSTPGGSKLSIFSVYGQQFPRYGPIFKIAILGMKLGNWAKFQKLRIYCLSTPGGQKFSLFSIYMQRFLRYRPIFTIAIFGHETGPLAKVPEVAHILPFYPKGSKPSLCVLYGPQLRRLSTF